MRMSLQKKLTKDFFNRVSGEWSERTYDPAGTFLKFPGNRARMETALHELDRLKPRGRVLDIGCGNGEFTIELLKRKIDAFGMDIAECMIANARKNLRRAKLERNSARVFETMDLEQLPRATRAGSFAAATGLGLLEYLETDEELFRVLRHMLRKGGCALVECRNKLFNLFSVNRYTSALAASGELPALVDELSRIDRYSPVPAVGLPAIQRNVINEMNHFMRIDALKKKWLKTTSPSWSDFPKKMVRRQHTPEELEVSAENAGFELRHVVYWHCHPYPPAWEKQFPALYNKLSYLMAPLGYTPLGAWMCSSFLAVLKKR